MPKRTNEFQKLVKMVQHSLSGDNVRITESAMESVEGLGFREIDILIEGEIGVHHIKIAVEAKDHRRKIDVTVVESIISKYYGVKSIPVNKVILVSSRGFTSGAIQKAKSANIKLMIIEKALDYNWKKQINTTEISFLNVIAGIKEQNELETEKLLDCQIDFEQPCAHEKSCQKPCIKHFNRKTIKESLIELFRRHIFDKQFRQNIIQNCESQNKEEFKLGLRYDFPPKSYIEFEGERVEIVSLTADTEKLKVSSLPLLPAQEMPFEFKLPLHLKGVRFKPSLEDLDIQDFFNKAMVWCKCQKGTKELDILPKWLDKAFEKHKDTIHKIREDNQKPIEEHLRKEGGYIMTISLPMHGFVLKYNNKEYIFETLHVDFIERRHQTKMKFESYKINQENASESCIHYGTAELPEGGKLRILMPDGMMSDKIILDIEGLK